MGKNALYCQKSENRPRTAEFDRLGSVRLTIKAIYEDTRSQKISKSRRMPSKDSKRSQNLFIYHTWGLCVPHYKQFCAFFGNSISRFFWDFYPVPVKFLGFGIYINCVFFCIRDFLFRIFPELIYIGDILGPNPFVNTI